MNAENATEQVELELEDKETVVEVPKQIRPRKNE
jgi:hypothetical protein